MHTNTMLGANVVGDMLRHNCIWTKDMQLPRNRMEYTVKKRTAKHAEKRAALAPEQDDTQAFEAYEDRERILNHISDMHYHGVHLRSMLAFVESLHHPAKFGAVTTLMVLEACGAIAA